ncbi:MAG TPA: glycosyltransferase family 39 protein [Planctomycetota bacterium]|nr:glycosyltransferase family 39 protein [Planctomycetota bacterium]
MSTKYGTGSPRLFWIVLGSVSIWKIAAAWKLTLCYDETYYHYWSLHPQLSYYDHPPLTGWLMTLSGWVLGNSVWTVRIWPLLLSTASVFVARAAAREIFDAEAGNRAGLLMALAPIFAGNGIVMTPDAVLVFFWTASVYLAWRALNADSLCSLWWVALGVTAGMGFLSKYNMVLFYTGLVLLFLISPRDRKRIFIGCLISGLIAAVIFSPVLIWNFKNHFASFRFQFSQRLTQVPKSRISNLAEYLGILIVVVTPVLGGLCFYSAGRRAFSKERRDKFCAALLWGVVVAFGYSAWNVHIQANWPMVAYVTGIILVAGVWSTYPRWVVRAALITLIAADAMLFTYALLPAQWSLAVGKYSLDIPRVREFTITPKIAAAVRRKEDEQQLDFICTSSQELFGVIQFYEPALRENLWQPGGIGRKRYPWIDENQFSGKNALLVSDRREWGKVLYFESIEPLGSADIPYKNVKLTLYFFKGKHYLPERKDLP